MTPTYRGSERAILDDTIDRNREALIASVARLSDAESRQRLVASATTPIGLIKHAAAVERFWFQWFLDRRTECDGPANPGEESYLVDDFESLDDVIAEFRRASAESRRIAARFDADDVVMNSRDEPVSVRYVLQHMIEEFARHAGHADILVEQIVQSR
ncbi:DinB family protein [Gordonia hydrophobica]|uniref:DinB family protein n=1 Tax=Gordonia hydrophobica TaxID=40516 RepID=A0ABZ2TZP0_9ACTN|nr:DinB family protein [Gordonia hydrophobica]MBM7369421.1 putative damage-inducible protein DinB [Gordonia hydrophobica]